MITHAQLDVSSSSHDRDQKYASYSESPLLHYSNNMMMYSESGVDISSMTGQNEMNSTNNERNLQGLSLSLNTQMSSVVCTPSFQFQYSNPGLSSVLSPNLPLSAENSVRQIDHTIRFGVPNEPQYSMNPKGLGFNSYDHEEAGIGSTMLRSRYLKAGQQLLDEVVNVHDSTKKHEFGIEKNSNHGDEESKAVLETNELSPTERQDLQNNLDKLHSLLDEVDRRYKQYCHQMQILISSFDMVAGGGSAKPYTSLARKTISRHFRCLRDAITTQIQANRKSLGEEDDNGFGAIPRLRYVDQKLKQQRALQQFGMMRHSWRPQRGLPESAVTILRAWLFEHFLHPYPKDSEKIMLARQTGLSRGQVANWFINARVRLWKPMVEEIHKEEFGDVEINPRSSPEHNPKADVQQESRPSMSHDSKTNGCDHLKDPTSSTSGFNIENNGFYTSAYQMSELGNFSIDSNSQQVSLALGLRGNGDAETSVEVSTSEYPYLEQNSHILNDFVA